MDRVEKLLDGGMRDVRCLLLKMADRKDNLRTIEQLKAKKQVRMAFETQAIFQPLREILHSDDSQSCTLERTQTLLQKYLADTQIDSAKQFKKSLLSTFFVGLDEGTYSGVCDNLDFVTWKPDEKHVFGILVASELHDHVAS